MIAIMYVGNKGDYGSGRKGIRTTKRKFMTDQARELLSDWKVSHNAVKWNKIGMAYKAPVLLKLKMAWKKNKQFAGRLSRGRAHELLRSHWNNKLKTEKRKFKPKNVPEPVASAVLFS